MNTFEALFLTIPISFAASTGLAMITAGSLRTTLEEITGNREQVAYWVPYSIAMLYLVPLFAGLVFGVGTIPRAGVDPAIGFTRILACVLGGCLAALAGIGLQLSKHNQRMAVHRRTESPARSRFDD